MFSPLSGPSRPRKPISSLDLPICIDKVCYDRVEAVVVTAGPEIEGEMYVGQDLVQTRLNLDLFILKPTIIHLHTIL